MYPFSLLRRRTKSDPGESSGDGSESPALYVSESDVVDSLKAKSKGKLHKIEKVYVQTKRPFLASRRFLFPLGLLLGTIMTTLYMPSIPPYLMPLLEEYDIFLPSLSGFGNISMPALEFEWWQLTEKVLAPAKSWLENRDFKVGEALAEEGLSAHHPIIIVPGIISTGLESWSTSPEYRHYFRKRLWGTATMIRAVVTEREKWVAALTLDHETGLDPPGIKVRAAQGIDAASSFMAGYWIWAKIIENLACINYDSNNLELAAYDWRVSFYNLEIRDGYFSKLKASVERFKKRENKKVVLVGHSMGGTVRFTLDIALVAHTLNTFSRSTTYRSFCFKWVEAAGFGGGGPNWVEDHIDSFVSIATPALVRTKAMAAYLSGEMKDTVELNPAGTYALERFFSRKERARLIRSWAGSGSLWVKGGNTIWGNLTHAPDDPPDSPHTFGQFFSFRPAAPAVGDENAEGEQDPQPKQEIRQGLGNLTVEEAGNWILEHTPETFQRMMASNYSYGFEKDEKILKKNNADHTKWTNPLEMQLPNAPSLKIYCLYGSGKETEVGQHEESSNFADGATGTCGNTTECSLEGFTRRSPFDLPLYRSSMIDVGVTEEGPNTKVKNGVRMGEGDGTVSLISLGAMCTEGWKRKRWNPAGVKIITHELLHRPETLEARGGPHTSDHVDILGAQVLNEMVLRVAAGKGDQIENHLVSNIIQYAQKINWD
ncbi:hypothetical protein BOTBODRAFT_35570 [Botryobasidium botryosum FD-172 SS1]|uniref:Phospholipid:diacylglycerol acyltransferase n=1 Tax=Botryobasidium botryosum (strain FD-172 SS1) TaxID=930990 RepID=A0A067M992_BOTB1|nr:hypothetical protein BOTBODRAFT_35570 [Botryobasidium botryosum FD-172 SS1]